MGTSCSLRRSCPRRPLPPRGRCGPRPPRTRSRTLRALPRAGPRQRRWKSAVTKSPFCTGRPSTGLSSANSLRSRSIWASTSSVVTSSASLGASTPLYWPSSTSGITVTVRREAERLAQFGHLVTEVDLRTVDRVDAQLERRLTRTSRPWRRRPRRPGWPGRPGAAGPWSRGTLPCRKPGMRTSLATFFRWESKASCSSSPETSTASLTVFPSRSLRVVFTFILSLLLYRGCYPNAGERTRTSTSKTHDPKSCASAIPPHPPMSGGVNDGT